MSSGSGYGSRSGAGYGSSNSLGNWNESRSNDGYAHGRRYESEGYGSNRYNDDNYDRGFFERAGDEVRSWFGDEEAERRREMDERHNEEMVRKHGRATFGGWSGPPYGANTGTPY